MATRTSRLLISAVLLLATSALPMALTIAVAALVSLLGFVALMKSGPLCYD